ncbi:hypothetical protein EDD22DRAFT_959640 [Suillus occidentalis]|nr:hypothetical protein EDD22DRAFT_959640 [Suillus occidentalis]
MTTTKNAHVNQPAPTKPPFLMPGDIMPEVLRTWEMGKVAWGMQEPAIQEWYLNDQERMDKLMFDTYITKVHAYWLPWDWADSTHQKLLLSVQGNKAFSDWAVEVQSLNAILRDLRTNYRTENVKAIVRFRPWQEKVQLFDEEHLHNLATLDAAFHAERLKNVGDKKLTSSSQFNSKAGHATTGKTGAFVCFKCREPFTKHTTATCDNGFPDGTTYKPVTAATIAAKKNKKSGMTVASVEVANTVAVVMPSAALGNGTDSDECVAPLTTPLLLWDCLINGPTSSERVQVLIDDSSTAALIDKQLVIKLGLQ